MAERHWLGGSTMGCIGVGVGLAIVLTLAGFGLSGLISATEHGESPVLGLVLLVIPLLVAGAGVAAVVSRAIPRTRERARAFVRAGVTLIVATLLGAALLLSIDANVISRRPSVDLTSALAPACAGRAVSGAALVGDHDNHLVLLDAAGRETAWTGFPPLAWRPAALDDAELVACVGPERTGVVEVCNYVGGSDVTRFAASRDVVVREARTGREVALFTITIQPRHCRPTERTDVTKLTASIDWPIVQEHLASLVDRGTFEDPDAEAAEPTPSPTGRPRPSQKPTAAPSPTVAVTTMELRKAMAAGLITAAGRGDGLQRLDLTVTSTSSKPLRISVAIGTMLDPGVGGTQTMVVLEPTTIVLAAREKVTHTLDVACAEMHDDQPGSGDRFIVRATQASSNVMKLLRSEEFASQGFRIRQFAIWTLQDNPPADGYVRLTSGLGGIGSGPSADELATIESLLRAAGINPERYRAFQ